MRHFSSLIYTLSIIFFSSFSCASEDESPSGTNNPTSPLSTNNPVNLKSQYPESSIFGPEGPTKIVDVKNPITGNTWMDRNLGATEAAVSSESSNSFGYLYQWGRRSDGHQQRNSPTTTTLSSTRNTLANSAFIIVKNFPFDWKTPQFSGDVALDVGLWKGVNGINNPCPKGYRIPTEAEWQAEINSWKSKDATGALGSVLKLPMGGVRSREEGKVNLGGGRYWTSEQIRLRSEKNYLLFITTRIVIFGPSNTSIIGSIANGNGLSEDKGAMSIGACVRCIKD
jgi:uncharacterized protein (TIGR02145 family)